MEAEDLKYAWAAYRMGGLPGFAEGLSASAFQETFEEEVLSSFDAFWTMFAEVKGKMQPVGLALGFWTHAKARTMVLDRLHWFPWATPRLKVECAVRFINQVRREIPLIGFARPKDKGFFVVLMQHGIIRQVGTSHNVFGDEPASVYETRWEH